jgi:hypothetical protein
LQKATGIALFRRRGEHIVGLYERLLQEAAELSEDPNQERNERMSAYLNTLRRPVPEGGGYWRDDSWVNSPGL